MTQTPGQALLMHVAVRQIDLPDFQIRELTNDELLQYAVIRIDAPISEAHLSRLNGAELLQFATERHTQLPPSLVAKLSTSQRMSYDTIAPRLAVWK
jgi:hypothetical protein